MNRAGPLLIPSRTSWELGIVLFGQPKTGSLGVWFARAIGRGSFHSLYRLNSVLVLCIAHYFCPGICRVPSPGKATGGPCRLMLWSILRVEEALRWRIEYYSIDGAEDEDWNGPHFDQAGEERYSMDLMEWAGYKGMSQESVEDFLKRHTGDLVILD